MKKIGILTLYKDNYNYGALLQARAMVDIVKSLDFDCEQISYSWYTDRYFRKEVNSTRKDNIKFAEFEKEIPHSNDIYINANIINCEESYDCILVGSDQVWNDELGPIDDNGGIVAFLLIPFSDKVGKVAYAASFGKKDVKALNRKVFSDALGKFDYISVREISGIDLINDLVPEVNATKVLDPTMLMAAGDWRKYKKTVEHKKKYIVAYLIGSRNTAKIAKRAVEKIADENDMELFILPDKNYGPAEFIDLIDNAEFVFSNSFHGTVFSIIFEKNFRTIGLRQEDDSKTTNSRMKDLLSELSLDEYYIDTEMIDHIDISETPTYEKTRLIMEKKKKESMAFLERTVRECSKRKPVHSEKLICEHHEDELECIGELDERAIRLLNDYWGDEEEKNGIRREDMEALFNTKGALLKEKCLSCPKASFKSFYHKLERYRFHNDVQHFGVEGLYYRYLLDNEYHRYESAMVLEQNRTCNQVMVANATKMKLKEKYTSKNMYIYGAATTGRALAKLIPIKAFIDAAGFYKVHPYVDDTIVLGLTEASEKVESDAIIIVTPWWDISSIGEKLGLSCKFISIPDFIDEAFE